MAHLTDPFEVRVTDYVARGVTPAALTTPMRVQILSALGAGDAASTPITGGNQAGIVPLDPTAAGTNPASNATIRRWDGLPNPTTVAGYRILDSAATPNVPLDNIPRTGGSVSVTDGVFEVPANGLTITSD